MVVGIGGTFMFAADAAALAQWYRTVLGIEWQKQEQDAPFYIHEFRLREARGEQRLTRCVLAIFPREPGNEAGPKSFTINYRVDDLDATLERALANGAALDRREDDTYGRFAWLTDPEGHSVELWEDLGIGSE
jgi:predicted enzyme related to lactoylglutathione lyase